MHPLRLLPLALLCTATVACAQTDPEPLVRVGRLQLIAQRLRSEAGQTLAGDSDAMSTLKADRARGADLAVQVAKLSPDNGVAKAWAQLDSDLGKVVAGEATVKSVAEIVSDLSAKLPVLNSRMDEVVKICTERSNGTKQQVMLASREMLLSDRMMRRIASIQAGGEESQAAADGLQRDWMFYRAVIQGLLDGNPDLNIAKSTEPSMRSVLTEIGTQAADLDAQMKKLLEATSALQDMRQAADASVIDGETVVLKSETVLAGLLKAR